MKEEIRRIMKLVSEGKLSPEDAAELIDAFQSNESEDQAEEEAAAAASAATGAGGDGGPPPPPPGATKSGSKDPFKSLIDAVEGIGKDITESVNWQDVARQVRQGAQKGVEGLKVGIEKIKEGKFNFDIFGAQEIRTVELPLSISEGKTLKVENPVGNVKIVGGIDVASVKATAKVRGLDADEARKRAAEYTLIIEESDHQVLIRQPDVSGLDVDLDIQIPAGIAVDVRTLSGDLHVTDTQAGGKFNASSGDVALRGMNGPLDITSNSGNVSVTEAESPSITIENKSGDVLLTKVRGNQNVRTASGDLKMHECSGRTLSIESVSGDVIIDLVEPITGTVSVRTVNGSSSLHVVDGSDCRVSLSTLRGTVSCSVELTDAARSEMHVTGRIGEGAGTLDISAVNGSVEMKLRDQTA